MTKQKQDHPTVLVGMDAHSDKIALCITHWHLGSDPRVVKEFTTTLDALETTYKQQVPDNSITILEASTNAFSIHARLAAIGQSAKVVASDTLAGVAQKDRVNDNIDARNLAFVYARNPNIREVLVPSEQNRYWRDLYFAYRDAKKDTVRYSNRIWAFCSGHGLKLPKRAFKRKAEAIRQDVAKHNWSPEQVELLNERINDYEQAMAKRNNYQKKIEKIVAQNDDMTKLTSILGVRFIIAFTLVAFIEDVQRFENPKKLVSYIGLNPVLNCSGKSKGANNLSTYGRSDIKALLTQAAQAVVRSDKSDLGNWARRKVAMGKKYNVMVCAVARKILTYVWHLLMGHPVLVRKNEDSFHRKIVQLASAVGRDFLLTIGFEAPRDFIEHRLRSAFPPTVTMEL